MAIGTAMRGESGDRKVVRNNQAWRVRVRVKDELPAVAPTNGEVLLAPSAISVSISVATLTKRNKVAKNAAGQLLVSDAHVATFQREQLERDDDPSAIIDALVEEQITAAEKLFAGTQKLDSALSGWRAG